MALEVDAEHVEDLTLHPVGALPEGECRRHRQIGLIEERLDDQAFTADGVEQVVDQAEAVAGVGVLVLMVWAVARAAGGARGVDDSPETILKRRYARGEIDREEYERRLSDMRR